jgi:hypothetical protein
MDPPPKVKNATRLEERATVGRAAGVPAIEPTITVESCRGDVPHWTAGAELRVLGAPYGSVEGPSRGRSVRKHVLITGSGGLVGSEAVTFFKARGWVIDGIDNNMRRRFFGVDGDPTWNLERLRRETRRFTHHDLDIRDRVSRGSGTMSAISVTCGGSGPTTPSGGSPGR